MSVFIDTGVFFSQHDEHGSRPEAATDAMYAIFSGQFGQPYTSDSIVDEAVTSIRKRTGSFDAAWTVGRRILGRSEHPDRIELLQLTSDLFEDSLATYRRYHDHQLSFADASTITSRSVRHRRSPELRRRFRRDRRANRSDLDLIAGRSSRLSPP